MVYRLAGEQRMTGLVRNDGHGVTVEVQGAGERLDVFVRRMLSELPRPGRIETCLRQPLPVLATESEFSISPSSMAGSRAMSLAPDSTVCPDCLREMNDPRDRRFHYPFITCTRCGPRYTIAERLPYDRPRTTMACFPMCPECSREYTDPGDRRFHAQPIACPRCGPRAWLVSAGCDPTRPRTSSDDPAEAIFAASQLLKAGCVVAVKGVGGFLLAADATNSRAVNRIRKLKQRRSKPLATMVRDIETARHLIRLDHAGEQLLCSAAAPIVLAPARPGHPLAQGIAPGIEDLGVMLPSSPLHHLLFDKELTALIMTSANEPAEPMITANRIALGTLPVDAYLFHDRDIHLATDDSVVRVSTDRTKVFVRRARGYVPESIDAGFLPRCSVLALGAELKVAVATLQEGRLIVGRHLGDLDNARTEEAYRREVARVLEFNHLQPEGVAVDQHPDLASTLLGEQLAAPGTLVRVQHHHAHLCSVMLEHGIRPDRTVTGIILDGTGYGTDGTIWGGEVISGQYARFERVGHLRPVPQPGGDQAAREPSRMATSLLLDAGLGRPGVIGYVNEIAEICDVRSVSPLTSSAGRVFDGAAALLGLAPEQQSYEGEAAARLEAAADPRCADAYPLPLKGSELDTRALIEALVQDRAATPIRAARFHNALADALATLALEVGNPIVALGGGCMVNRLLFARLRDRLYAAGAHVIYARSLPPGDGGLSAGQAAVAACRLSAGTVND